MTDRVITLTVVLKKATREDDMQKLMDAIQQLRGVLAVKIGGVNSSEVLFAEMNVRNELRQKLWAALEEE